MYVLGLGMYVLPPPPLPPLEVGLVGCSPLVGGHLATGFFRSPVDSRPRRFVSADIFTLSEQAYLSPAIDFSYVGKQAAEPETKN